MDKTSTMIVGGVAALASIAPAGAAPADPAPKAASFAQLLDPIPDAVARLEAAKAFDAANAPAGERSDPVLGGVLRGAPAAQGVELAAAGPLPRHHAERSVHSRRRTHLRRGLVIARHHAGTY